MYDTKKSHSMLAVPALFLAVVLIGACVKSEEKTISPASGLSSSVTGTVGMSACITCHAVVTAEWLTSKHANLDPAGTVYSAGVPTIGIVLAGGPGCIRCHDPNGDSAKLTAGNTGNVARPVIGCETCHGPGSLHAGNGGSGPISRYSGTYDGLKSYSIGTVTVSGQFVMCTNCHELLNSSGAGTVVASHGPAGSVTPTGSRYIITDTHLATPGDWSGGANSKDIAGYAMDFASEMVCTDCHNPHTSADINREWASSLHSDLTATHAWAHYNWTCDDANCGGPFGSRTICQRCHTTTGFKAYADALRNSNTSSAAAIFSGSQPPLAYDANFKPELLECKGCHIDNQGNLRNPGAYQASYKIPVGGFPANSPLNADVPYPYPNISASNVCMPCHTGLGSGKAVSQLNTGRAAAVDFSNLGFPDGHYLTAGGTMFKGTGYEYGGRNYADPASYKHNQIGTSAQPGTGTMGPCIGCHMDRANANANHLFKAVGVGKDSNGNDIVTSMVSDVCYNCHAGSSSSLAAIAEQEKLEYEDSLAALAYQLDAKGISFYKDYPYMFQQRYRTGIVQVTKGSTTVIGVGTLWSSASITTTDHFRTSVDNASYSIASVIDDTTMTLTKPYTGPSFTAAYIIMMGTQSDGVKNWLFGGTESDGRSNLGAAFNLSLLHHEPGAYVHNSRYAKRLIYDSLDWLDDGTMNYSVGTKLNDLPTETAYKAGAMKYLLPSGALWNGAYPNGYGIAAERP